VSASKERLKPKMATTSNFSASHAVESTTNGEGKVVVRVPLHCTGKWKYTMTRFDINNCEDKNLKGVLIQIGGEIVNMVILRQGVGQTCKHCSFELDGSELEILLLDGTPQRNPIPRVKFFAMFELTVEK
jgi:hypothetical protein